MIRKSSIAKRVVDWFEGVFRSEQLTTRPMRRRGTRLPLAIEILEDRLAPATLIDGGAGGNFVTISFDAAAGETVTISPGATSGTYNLTSTAPITNSMTDPGNTLTGSILTVAGTVTTINIDDALSPGGTSALIFANSANSYAQAINVIFANGLGSGGIPINFGGTATFGNGLTALTDRANISSASGSAISAASNQSIMLTTTAGGSIVFGGTVSTSGAGNLAINAAGEVKSLSAVSVGGDLSVIAGADLRLRGALTVGGATNLGSSGQTFGTVADNPNNSFTGGVALSSLGDTTIRSNGAITLGNASMLTNVTVSGDLNVTAGGAVTQFGATTITADGATIHNTSTTAGDITLTNSGNAFSQVVGAVNLENDFATGNIGISSNQSLTLGDVTLGTSGTGTGLLSIAVGVGLTTGDLDETGLNGIRTNGDVNITNSVIGTVDLSNSPNNIGGTVTFNMPAGDIGLHNINPNAVIPTFSGVGNLLGGSLNNVTLIFDNTGGTLPDIAITGRLIVREAAAITQGVGTTIAAVGAEFTVFGNFGITINNVGNNITSNVGSGISLNNPNADATAASAVAFAGAGPVFLDDSNLGLGAVSITADGDIRQNNGKFAQKRGPGGPVSFDAGASGTTIDLSDTGNEFDSMPLFAGASLSTVAIDNANPLASIPPASLFLPGTVNAFTLNFENAPAVLPTINVATLNVTALGIVQASTATVTSTTATFTATTTAGSAPIVLGNTGNSIANISVNNSGPNDVVVNVAGALNFNNSNVGYGRLKVTASGAITESGFIHQAGAPAAAPVSFTTGAAAITLDNLGNIFTGPVSLTNTGANAVTIHTSEDLILGASSIGGDLTIQAGKNITQFAGSALTVAGASTFDTSTLSGDDIVVDNVGNNLTGNVALDSAINATLRNNAAVVLAASSVHGDLTVHAAGDITQAGDIIDGGTAYFDTGVASGRIITLNNTNNDFTDFSAFSTRNVSVHDANEITLDQIQLGATGALTVRADADGNGDGNILQTISATLVGNTVSLDIGGPALVGNGNISLNSVNNNFTGGVSIAGQGLGDLTLTNKRNLAIALAGAGPAITLGNVNLSAQQSITFTNAALTTFNVASLSCSAQQTTISATTITASSGNISFAGTVNLPANVVLDTYAGGLGSGVIHFTGNVNPAGAVTINLPTGGSVNLLSGVWNQAGFALNINGDPTAGSTPPTFTIGGTEKATFAIGTATITMTSGGSHAGSIDVANNGDFKVTGAATLDDGAGTLTFESGSTYEVGIGASSDKLTKVGSTTPAGVVVPSGDVIINYGTRLSGFGLGGTSTILDIQGGGSVSGTSGGVGGFFTNSVDANNNPIPFLMGTDIMTASYAQASIAVQQATGGQLLPVANTGIGSTITVFEPDGDKVVVFAPAAANLVGAIEKRNGNSLIIALRGAGSAVTTLTITTTKSGGDGFARLSGIGSNVTGPLTISGATADITGDIRTAGQLAALTIHNMNSGLLQAQGAGAQNSSITGSVFHDVDISLASTLNVLTLKEYSATTGNKNIDADHFGTIKITGDTKAGIAGDFHANLTSHGTATSALTSATVAGDLGGNWDLLGTVGTVTAHTTTGWTLGVSGGPGTINPRGVSKSGALNLGPASNSNINVFAANATNNGSVASIAANSWNGGNITADTIGTITTTGNTATGDIGDFSNINMLLRNSSGITPALKSLTVKGNMASDDIEWLDGNAGSITAGFKMSNTTIRGDLTAASLSGVIGTIQAAELDTDSLDARSVSTFKVVANSAAQLPGDLNNVSVTLHGTAGATTASLGTLTAVDVINSPFTVENGSVTTFTVTRRLNNSPIQVLGGAGGTLGTISVGDWTNSNLTAKSIGTLKTVGAVQTTPSSALLGNLNGSIIDTFLTGATGVAIGTLSVAGNLDMSGGPNFIRADNGITSLTVKRKVLNGQILVSNSSAATIGKIGSITAGSWTATNLEANLTGAVSITGFTAPESPAPNFTFGNLANSSWTVNGAGGAGIASLTTNGDISNVTLIAPYGLPKVTIGGALTHGSLIFAENQNAALGKIGALTAKRIDSATIDANSITSLATIKGTVFDETGPAQLNGNILGSHITAVLPSGTGIGTMSVAGGMEATDINAPGALTKLTVAETVSGSQFDVAFGNPTAKLGALSVAAWLANDLTANNVGSFTVVGNASRSIVGNMTNSVITIIGQIAGVGLGTFSATGSVQGSTFNVASGNVTSFTTGRFIDSSLLVGFHIPKASDILTAPTAGNWSPSALKIGTFKTTSIFNGTDVDDTAGFVDSDVVAPSLGVVSITGASTVSPTIVHFGICFKQTGGSAGTFTNSGSAPANFKRVALAP